MENIFIRAPNHDHQVTWVFILILADSDVLPMFQQASLGAAIVTPDKYVESVAEGGCARACANEPSFDCRTFSYCENSNECSLTHERLQGMEGPDKIMARSDCTLFQSK